VKKIDKKIEAMRKYGILTCPKCSGEFHIEGKSLKCGMGHTYDISKKGTVNFVLGYGEENYNLAMLEARERVISEGFFDDIVLAVCEEIYTDYRLKGDMDKPLRILDAGCGDGSFSRRKVWIQNSSLWIFPKTESILQVERTMMCSTLWQILHTFLSRTIPLMSS